MVRAVLVVCLAALAGACAASARTVSYNNVISPTKLISCFAVQHSSEIECTAPYLPDIGEFDTYLGLKPRGRARLAQRSDFPGYTTRRRTLHYGDVWKRPGLRCVMRTRGLTCRNRDRHGFHIQRGHVGRF
jgi:hypothetical protein